MTRQVSDLVNVMGNDYSAKYAWPLDLNLTSQKEKNE